MKLLDISNKMGRIENSHIPRKSLYVSKARIYAML
jgi:hypothetical protein